MLRQNVEFFDTQATTGSLLEGLNEDGNAVQQAISEKVGETSSSFLYSVPTLTPILTLTSTYPNPSSLKVGDFLQHTATFAVGYAIAFWRGWDMTLVMVGTLPFLAGVGAILAKLSTYTAAKSSAAYVEASSLAQQVSTSHPLTPSHSDCSNLTPSPHLFLSNPVEHQPDQDRGVIPSRGAGH